MLCMLSLLIPLGQKCPYPLPNEQVKRADAAQIQKSVHQKLKARISLNQMIMKCNVLWSIKTIKTYTYLSGITGSCNIKMQSIFIKATDIQTCYYRLTAEGFRYIPYLLLLHSRGAAAAYISLLHIPSPSPPHLPPTP